VFHRPDQPNSPHPQMVAFRRKSLRDKVLYCGKILLADSRPLTMDVSRHAVYYCGEINDYVYNSSERRAMRKLLVLLVGGALAVGISITAARAQIKFSDGTTQTTAYTRQVIPVGAAYSQTVYYTLSGGIRQIGTTPVPTGKELVILQCNVGNGGWDELALESRLPSPNQNTGPITLTVLGSSSVSSGLNNFVSNFPDGAVVVASGRIPYLVHFDSVTGNPSNSALPAVTLLGYYRNAP